MKFKFLIFCSFRPLIENPFLKCCSSRELKLSIKKTLKEPPSSLIPCSEMKKTFLSSFNHPFSFRRKAFLSILTLAAFARNPLGKLLLLCHVAILHAVIAQKRKRFVGLSVCSAFLFPLIYLWFFCSTFFFHFILRFGSMKNKKNLMKF